MITLLFLISSMILAQDSSIEEFCFSGEKKAHEINNRVKFILIPSDKLQQNGNCLSISTLAHRRELIQNYVKNLDQNVSIKFSSAEIKRDPCKLKVEKIYSTKSKNHNVQAWPSANLEHNQVNGSRNEISQISTLKDFELLAYENRIKGECRYIHDSLYEIKLESSKLAKPLPQVVVLGHNPELLRPTDEKLSHLSTTVQLRRGERMHLGSVIKNHDNNGSHIKTLQASGHTQQAAETEEIYLSIE